MADIFRRQIEGPGPRLALNREQLRVARDIIRCRTAALGGHLQICQACDLQRPAYNSCRNRHCPKCLALAQARWVALRLVRTLPTHHFHVVFTLPAEVAELARTNRAAMFELLMRSAAASLLALGRDPHWLAASAQLGITAVLHTWTRDLRWHPHVHCIVTGGGLDSTLGRWVVSPQDFLFPVHVLGALFRGKFLAGIDQLRAQGRLHDPLSDRAARRRRARLFDQSWVVYAKRPFGGTQQVLRYLSRYTHRIAISNIVIGVSLFRLVTSVNEASDDGPISGGPRPAPTPTGHLRLLMTRTSSVLPTRTNFPVFIVVGGFMVVAYNLALAGRVFHNDHAFALSWGAFPFLTAYWVMDESLGWPALVGAAACFACARLQRALSTPARVLRRRVAEVKDGSCSATDRFSPSRVPFCSTRRNRRCGRCAWRCRCLP